MTRHLPAAGIAASLGLFVAAAAHYPGGSNFEEAVVGYDWTRHFISTLFAPRALNGAENGARAFAIPAMALLCSSAAFVFWRLSRLSGDAFARKAIEIGGIGAPVYAFLAVATPLHDLLLLFVQAFFLVAVAGTLVVLRAAGARALFAAGIACVALGVACAVMYYGIGLSRALAICQKAQLLATAAWIAGLHYAELRPKPS